MTKEHNAECKKLLGLMGVPYIEAPCEAEAQCAALCRADKVWGTASEDMDSLTFGTPRMLRHLTFSEARKLPITEFNFDKVLQGLGMTHAEVPCAFRRVFFFLPFVWSSNFLFARSLHLQELEEGQERSSLPCDFSSFVCELLSFGPDSDEELVETHGGVNGNLPAKVVLDLMFLYGLRRVVSNHSRKTVDSHN